VYGTLRHATAGERARTIARRSERKCASLVVQASATHHARILHVFLGLLRVLLEVVQHVADHRIGHNPLDLWVLHGTLLLLRVRWAALICPNRVPALESMRIQQSHARVSMSPMNGSVRGPCNVNGAHGSVGRQLALTVFS
jgi:hypothetical protein